MIECSCHNGDSQKISSPIKKNIRRGHRKIWWIWLPIFIMIVIIILVIIFRKKSDGFNLEHSIRNFNDIYENFTQDVRKDIYNNTILNSQGNLD